MATTSRTQVQRSVACFAAAADGSPVLGNAVIGNVQPVVNHVADDLNEPVAFRVGSHARWAFCIFWFVCIEHGYLSHSCGITSIHLVLPSTQLRLAGKCGWLYCTNSNQAEITQIQNTATPWRAPTQAPLSGVRVAQSG